MNIPYVFKRCTKCGEWLVVNTVNFRKNGKWLRDNGYLIKQKGADYNTPTQRAMDLKLFEVKETSVTHSNGSVIISKTTKVTGKGQIYFINKFKEVK